MSKFAGIGLLELVATALLASAALTSAWSDDAANAEFSAPPHTDFPAALHLLRPLADQGDAEAQYRIGQIYEQAQTANNNGAEALKWYRLAAVQGHPNAQFSLGRLYVIGRDISQNYVQAYKWFTLAEAGFSEFDTVARARSIKAREVISPMMSPAQIEQALKLATDQDTN